MSDLNYNEVERLIKKEVGEVYSFFKSSIPKPHPHQNKFLRGLTFARSLLNEFILRLNPARRVFYLIAVFFFVVGYYLPNNLYLIASFIIINLLLAFELADKLSAKSELDVARNIQFDLIPKHPERIGNFEIATYYEPAKEVGGDYFDIIETPGRTFFIVGDISGKGMAAALYMVRVQAIIYQLINQFESLHQLVIDLKKYFSKNLRREYFLTLSILTIEEDGTIKTIRAGHQPVFYFSSSQNEVLSICPQGMGIGLNDKGLFEKTLEEYSFKPSSGDLIFLFTDGLTETMNIHKDQFGDANVKRIIKNNAGHSVGEIIEALLMAINSFRGTANQSDDITMVILKAK